MNKGFKSNLSRFRNDKFISKYKDIARTSNGQKFYSRLVKYFIFPSRNQWFI